MRPSGTGQPTMWDACKARYNAFRPDPGCTRTTLLCTGGVARRSSSEKSVKPSVAREVKIEGSAKVDGDPRVGGAKGWQCRRHMHKAKRSVPQRPRWAATASEKTQTRASTYTLKISTPLTRTQSRRAWRRACSDMFWGDRMRAVADPFGHNGNLATFKRQVSPAEMEAVQGGRRKK
jgi:hypothetical protein